VATEVGFDAVWVPDHFMIRLEAEGNQTRGVWECWTVLGGLAAASARIMLVSFVTCTGFRHPALIAKLAESVDDISGGRFVLGVGAGWHQPEYDMFGLPFDHRVGRFEEALKIIHPLVREGVADFEGTYYRVEGCVNRPRGPQAATGGIPILIGGSGPRLLRLTATYADAWNSDWKHDPEELMPTLAALDEACDKVGRDPATLVRTSSSNFALPGMTRRRPNPIVGDQAEMAAAIAGFRDLDLGHYVCGLDPCTPQSLEWFGRVIEMVDA
jgi:alkanesulfonate monooxygenase SsuD/methylene tetrahydromethanopterin reductase-like flavin-dependent oxidoreductase (luciferase family)